VRCRLRSSFPISHFHSPIYCTKSLTLTPELILVSNLITPRTLRGFRDYPPELMIPRERLMEAARRVYRSYGFAPIDTPALELTEILLARIGEGAEVQKQLYRFQDNGGRDVALRFDLTVPLARFVAQHAAALGTPFKRYHFGTVWRGEAPQAGRYREFMQCDFDTIGTTANAADIEIALVIHDLMLALGVERFQVRVNNRLLLNGVLESLGVPDKSEPLLRALDKLPKVGREAVVSEMAAAGVTPAQAGEVIALAETTGSNEEVLASVASRFGSSDSVRRGLDNLTDLRRVVRASGVPEERLKIDLSICRGLDYYTGTVYETFLTDLEAIGSVCSGGRYDNLTGRYTKQALPGVGASLGLDRLIAAMEQLGLLPKVATPAEVFVVQFDAARLGDYQRIARTLRAQGLGVEVYPEAKKIGQQLQYAERKGYRVALIAGENEFVGGVVKVKDLARRAEEAVAESLLAETIRKVLTAG
jgi:histidyl-tRNA synthetase